jgi:hypothetical protein
MISDRTFGTFTHFQSALATTTFIVGEFPWQVRRDDKARTKDYIDPPFMLSAETTEQDTTWSLGEYTSGKHSSCPAVRHRRKASSRTSHPHSPKSPSTSGTPPPCF